MNHDQHDPWAQKEHYPEDKSRHHADSQGGGHRSEASIEREIERRADQASKDRIQDQAIQDLKASVESLEFQNRHLLEEVANSKAEAKAAVNGIAQIKKAWINEAKVRGELTRKTKEESREAKIQAEVALRIAKENRNDLRALGWIRSVLQWAWRHKGKLGSAGAGGTVLLGIIAKLLGFSPV